MFKIITPKFGASDTTATVVTLNYTSGEFINENDCIMEVETSKAVHEILAENSGYFYSELKEGEEVQEGGLIGYLSTSVLKDTSSLFNRTQSSEKRITKKAAKLIHEFNLNIDDFEMNFIREQDVLNQTNAAIKELKFNQEDVLILGAGGHATMCLDIAKAMDLNIVGYLDDNPKSTLRDLAFLGPIKSLDTIAKDAIRPRLILGVGFLSNLKKRQKLFLHLSKEFEFINLIHPNSMIETSASIPSFGGIQIMSGAIVGSDVVIEPNVIINSGAIISHHSFIGHSAHITPGACLAGNVIIGQRSTIGMNSTIFLGLSIPEDAVIPNLTSINPEK